ncbi:10513_t:CDS:2 [Ambispora leptoticha]|uniref:10513_t:CDS:1 n=1 Tax=Ambispora leptoticha TaxID=144679 RepID=A0A9N8WBW0_9GLOM|nr:10513_t:CDS:2 [Ambispora leptoticha]
MKYGKHYQSSVSKILCEKQRKKNFTVLRKYGRIEKEIRNKRFREEYQELEEQINDEEPCDVHAYNDYDDDEDANLYSDNDGKTCGDSSQYSENDDETYEDSSQYSNDNGETYDSNQYSDNDGYSDDEGSQYNFCIIF